MRGKAERRYHKPNRVNLVSISIYGWNIGRSFDGVMDAKVILVVLQTESLIRHSTEGNGLIEPLRH